MSTVQIWATSLDMETLRRIQEFLEYQQEEEFGDREYRLSESFRWRGKNRRKRIKRKKITFSYIYREALNSYWNEHEEEIIKYEKKNRR